MVSICSFCKSEFTSRQGLSNHLRTAKYCLQKRLNNSSIKCLCGNKSLDDQNFEAHKQVCITYRLSERNKSLEEENRSLVLEKNQLAEKVQKLEKRLEYIQGQFDVIVSDKEKYYSTVEKAALDKKTVNNNQYNNLLTFPVLDKDRMDEKCKMITPVIVRSGQVALANFFVNKVATNEKGEIGVICTDKTRKTFRYLRQDGKIVTDIEAENIIKSFKASSTIHIEKSLEQLKKEYESDDLYESEEEKLEAYYNTAKEAREFGGPFLNQLIKRTYKKTEDGTLIAIPPTNIIKETDGYIDGIPKSQYEEWEKYIN